MPPIAVLVALADPTRCRILEILRDGAQPVHGLAASFKISRPAISRHLRVLKSAKLIKEKKAGRENHYALTPQRLAAVSAWLGDFSSDKSVVPADTAKATPKVARKASVNKARKPAAEIPAPVAVIPKSKPAKPAKAAGPKPDALVVPPASVSQMGFDF